MYNLLNCDRKEPKTVCGWEKFMVPLTRDSPPRPLAVVLSKYQLKIPIDSHSFDTL